MKRNLWGKRIRLTALVLVLVATAAGCVKPDAPTVAISKKKASLVFGVTVNEPVQPITAALPPLLAGDEPLDPDLFADEPLDLVPTGPAPAPKEECPKADLDAVAGSVATHNVSGPVPVGGYRWVRSGFVSDDEGQFPFTGFDRRTLTEYAKISDTVSQFKFTYRVPFANLVAEDTYRVRTDGFNRGTTDGVAAPATGPRVGENDRGLQLMNRKYINPQGRTVSEFAPQTGLLLLPLPASPAEEWTSVAVDSKNGLTIVHRGKTTTTKRVDACGELVDGWAVESTQTYAQGPASTEVKYDYVVAPQFGAMLIQEHHVQTVGDVLIDISFTIGQIKPS